MSLRDTQENIFRQYDDGSLKFLSKKSKIPFKCTMCGKCCRNVEIMLNPYDILEASRFLKISSADFCRKFVAFHIGGDSHLPVAMLKHVREGECAFLKEEENGKKKCSIHPARPHVCRMFPLGRVLTRKKGDGQRRFKVNYFFLKDEKENVPGIGNGVTTFEKFAKDANLKEWGEGTEVFLAGFGDIVEQFHTERLTESDYQTITPLLYCPDTALEGLPGASSSSDWIHAGLLGVRLWMEANGLRREQKTET